MALPLTSAPEKTFKSFLDCPLETELSKVQADVAIIGSPMRSPTRWGNPAQLPHRIISARSRPGSRAQPHGISALIVETRPGT